MSDTLPEARSAEVAGCPVDHRSLAGGDHRSLAGGDRGTKAAEAGGCPVDHLAARPTRATSTCAYAPGAGKRGYFVPGLIAFLALLVCGALIDAFAVSHGSSDHLAGPLVANQIATSVQERTAGTALPAVSCPAAEPVTPGLTFTCQLSGGAGRSRPVMVHETGGGRFSFSLGAVPGPGGAGA